jgi:Uri superfamily endonuclease
MTLPIRPPLCDRCGHAGHHITPWQTWRITAPGPLLGWKVQVTGLTSPLESSLTTRPLLPTGPGTYVLLLWLDAPCDLAVGSIGPVHLAAGYYLYVGSALGGLGGRLRRYIDGPKRIHWHIDYLLQAAQIVEIWYHLGPERLECVWVDRLGAEGSLATPVMRFGSSDCLCPTHLMYARLRPTRDLLGDSSVQVLRLTQ